jgi:alkylated DNA repair dioxygenase AlkB
MSSSSKFITSERNLKIALEITKNKGFAYLPQILDQSAISALLAELENLPLSQATPVIGKVRQDAQIVSLSTSHWPETTGLKELAAELETSLSASSWVPNEATIMRYQHQQAGITAHRDHLKYKKLIVILSLSGESELSIVKDRESEELIADYTCLAGDIVLLRGADLIPEIDGEDPRPLHAVRNRTAAERVSLTFRMQV